MNGGFAHLVIAGHDQALGQGQRALIQRGVIVLKHAMILRVDVANTADGRYPKRNQVAIGLRRVSLEIALQRAFVKRNGQFVTRKCKMIHPDVDIARVKQRGHRQLEHRELFRRRRERSDLNAPLRHEPLGQVRITIECDAIRPPPEHGDQRGLHRFDGLVRQAIDQVEIDRFVSKRAALLKH